MATSTVEPKNGGSQSDGSVELEGNAKPDVKETVLDSFNQATAKR
jgi:hypothetical protein